ncbi:MAG: hypothetical protein HC910_01780 [Spirulinaceae cyanobacterium SM2_1_0]|nr:hypothetical protein [Spirulinaceae cyanobacterium SM2_1_0]
MAFDVGRFFRACNPSKTLDYQRDRQYYIAALVRQEYGLEQRLATEQAQRQQAQRERETLAAANQVLADANRAATVKNRKADRRLRLGTGALAAMLVVAGGAGLWAREARQDNRHPGSSNRH